MPNLGESKPGQLTMALAKLLLLGDSKAGKTHYAMQAAKAGFNVLYMDGDVGAQTLMQLDEESRKRIYYLPCADYTDESGNYVPNMAKFFVEFCTSGVMTWNDTKGRVFDRKEYERVPKGEPGPEGETLEWDGDEIWQIRPAKMAGDTVLIMDSWTTLITSLQQWKAGDLNIDILDVEKLERDMYTGTGHKATQFLTLLKGLRCHLIVIGHPREYVKRSVPAGSRGNVPEKDMKVDWIKMVPASTSNPHALTMGKNFSDIAWITVTGTGDRKIDFRPSNERVQGGHFAGFDSVDKLSFAKLVEEIGGKVPTNPSPDGWLTRYGPGEFVPAGSKPAPVLNKSQPSQINTSATAPKGLAGMLAKQKGADEPKK